MAARESSCVDIHPLTPVPCFVCGRPLEEEGVNQPYKGLAFITHGHYGGTVFDPMDGHFLEVNICDPCLVARQQWVLLGRDRKPRLEDGVIVGFDDVAEPYHPWDPGDLNGWDPEHGWERRSAEQAQS